MRVLEAFETRVWRTVWSALREADGGRRREAGKPAALSVRRVARGGVLAFALYAVGVGLAYCSQLVIARVIGIEDFGIYTYALAWIVVLAYLAALGFDVSLLRFLPNYQAGEDWKLINGLLQYAHRRVAATGVILGALGAVVVVLSEASRDTKVTFVLGFALLPVLALLRIRSAAVRAFGGVIWALAPDRILREGIMISSVLIFGLALGVEIGAPGVMLAMLLATIVGLVCSGVALKRQLPDVVRATAGIQRDQATWLATTLPLLLAGTAEVVMNRTGVILIGWAVDTKHAGIYSLAFSIAMVVTLPRVALNTLFAPAISGHHARDDKTMMQRLVTSTAMLSLVTAMGIGGVFFVYADVLLGWFGPGYSEGVPALRVLLIGQIFAAAAGSQLYVMTMSGHERNAARLLVAVASVNGLLTLVSIPVAGLLGAAVASSASLILWNIAMSVYLWARLDIKPGTLAAVAGVFPDFAGPASAAQRRLMTLMRAAQGRVARLPWPAGRAGARKARTTARGRAPGAHERT